MELFRRKIIFLPESVLIKLQFSILQLDWKKGLQHRCILMNFARYLRHLLDRTPPCDCFCFTEKCFTNKIAKNPLSKEKNGNTCKKKLRHMQIKNLITLYIKSSYPFTIKKFCYFSFLSIIYWKHEFLETVESHWGFIYYRKLFATFCLKKKKFLSIRM